MCTVTFIPTKEGFFLTSSRDEKASRWTIPPMSYMHMDERLFYPKDEVAGGTWIAASPRGRAACLLNGAFNGHKKLEKYSKSRGLILLDSILHSSILDYVSKVNFKGIEPFTLLSLDYHTGKLSDFYELRWDGEQKHLKQLNTTEHKIWSSATLYSHEVQIKRINLFKAWIETNKHKEDKAIIDFHNRRHGLNASDDLLMKGSGDLRTLSISQIEYGKGVHSFNYYDAIKNVEYNAQLNSLINEKI